MVVVVRQQTGCVDEFKAELFAMACVFVPRGIEADAAEAFRGQLRPGQRSIHFKDDLKHSGVRIVGTLADLAGLGVQSIVFDASAVMGNEAAKRSACLRAIVLRCTTDTQLLIDRDDSLVRLDQQVIIEARHKLRIPITIEFQHVRRHDQPLVWLPDVVVGCYGRKGLWRQRIRPVLSEVVSLLH